MKPDEQTSRKNSIGIRVDLRFLVIVLLVVIACMLAIWKPWTSTGASDRTVTVTGEAKLTAEPDEYTFSPSYEFKNANKDVALADLTKKSDEVVKKLKELGVADSKIKTNADGYDYYNYYFDTTADEFTYTLRPTVSVNNKTLAQKVQDYLVTTSPSGQVSPQAGFSTAKQKELEGKARDEATKDARAKADQSAKNLGFKVSKVKSISDGANFGGITPYLMEGAELSVSSDAKAPSLAVQPGENDLTYSVTVIYFIR